MQDTTTDLKTRLEELIQNSFAINTLPEEERQEKKEEMLSAEPEVMREYIAILEDEQRDFIQNKEELQALVSQVKVLKNRAQRVELQEKEEQLVEREKNEAEELLKQLDEI